MFIEIAKSFCFSLMNFNELGINPERSNLSTSEPQSPPKIYFLNSTEIMDKMGRGLGCWSMISPHPPPGEITG